MRLRQLPSSPRPNRRTVARGPRNGPGCSPRRRAPRVFAATTIAQGLAESTSPASRKGRGGTSIGRAVHAVLQTVDLAKPDDLDDSARAQAAVEGLPAEG